MLNELRYGQTTPEIVKKLRELSRSIVYDDDIEPMELCVY